MKVRLLYPETNASTAPVTGWEDRAADLHLEAIVEAMSAGDPLIRQTARQMLNQPLLAPEEIRYRQEILQEFLDRPRLGEALYEICREAEEKRRSTWSRLNSPHLTTVYSSGIDLLRIYMEALVSIRKRLEAEQLRSPGLRQLSGLLQQELSDGYLEELRQLQPGLDDSGGILISAGFGSFLQGVSYRKRQPAGGLSKIRWLLQPSYTLAAQDLTGAKDFEAREERALNEAANVLAQAAGSLQSFVDQLRTELAFYLGGIRLYRRFSGLPLCFPEFGERRLYRGLYDGSLALNAGISPVGSSLQAEGKRFWLITGANQGGKTTFLRGVGLCQLMAQCGLFVFAEECVLPLRQQIFTHFGREEDRSLSSGKLDEELVRMSRIIDTIRPGAMLLSNESFSSTNDRDGSALFEEITCALLDRDIEVFSVTHLIGYACSMARRKDTLSLRPQRKEDGSRTFRLVEAPPTPEAYAEDLYRRVFSPGSEASP